MNCIVTSSWDKTIKYWDGKTGTPMAQLHLPERAYCMDIRYPLSAPFEDRAQSSPLAQRGFLRRAPPPLHPHSRPRSRGSC